MTTLITHYDLDGVTSAIVLNSAIKFNTIFKGGYHRIPGFVSDLKDNERVILADISVDESLFDELIGTTGNYVIIDHHPETIKTKKEHPNANIIADNKKAGCRLCYDFILELNSSFKNPQIAFLVKGANAYDLWKKDTPEFQFGYDLNILFWEYHFDRFFARFKDGFDGFNEYEKDLIILARNQNKELVEKSSFSEINSESVKSLICVPVDNSIANDITLFVDGFDVYFIIMGYKNQTKISVRSKGIDLQPGFQHIKQHPAVNGAGGHPKAGGIEISDSASDSDVIDVINTFHKLLEHEIDIPF